MAMVFRFSWRHLSLASDVMKEINSDTHSCIVSLASFAIFAFVGKDFFIILDTFAIGSNLSCSLTTVTFSLGGAFDIDVEFIIFFYRIVVLFFNDTQSFLFFQMMISFWFLNTLNIDLFRFDISIYGVSVRSIVSFLFFWIDRKIDEEHPESTYCQHDIAVLVVRPHHTRRGRMKRKLL